MRKQYSSKYKKLNLLAGTGVRKIYLWHVIGIIFSLYIKVASSCLRPLPLHIVAVYIICICICYCIGMISMTLL